MGLTAIAMFCSLQGQQEGSGTAGSWLVVAGQNSISEKWGFPTVGILRTDRFMEKTAFGFFRTGVTYMPHKKIAYTLGVAYLDTQPFHHTEYENLTTQQWTYEEFSYNTQISVLKLHHRWRWEQRWIKKPNTTSFNMRFRYRFQISYSVFPKTYLKMFNEPFMDLSKGTIDQNRSYLGIGKRMTPNLALEIGYFKNHLGKNNYDLVRMAILFKTKLYKASAIPKNTEQ